jgi:hypothetical protein
VADFEGFGAEPRLLGMCTQIAAGTSRAPAPAGASAYGQEWPSGTVPTTSAATEAAATVSRTNTERDIATSFRPSLA